MEQLPQFVGEKLPSYSKWNCTLYRLKQALELWFQCLTSPSWILLQHAWFVSHCSALLVALFFLLLDVDDTILTGRIYQWDRTWVFFERSWHVILFLGHQSTSHTERYSIVYAHDILNPTQMDRCKPISTPLATKSFTSSDDLSLLDGIFFYIGTPRFFIVRRPDFSNAVNLESRLPEQACSCNFVI